VVLQDAGFTAHPLVMSSLMAACWENDVVLVTLGEALQISGMQDPEYLRLGWHEPFAFMMRPWLDLEQQGRIMYFQLRDNFRLPPDQFALLMRVRLATLPHGLSVLPWLSWYGSH